MSQQQEHLALVEQTDISRQVQVSYDRLVLDYAARNDAATPSKLLRIAEQLVHCTGQNGRLLDVGCGTGREMKWFESRGVRTCGIDLSLGMLAYARSRVRGELFAMNMMRLGFRDASFDAVWCCASLLHLKKVEAPRALSEMHRLLKRHGLLALIVQQGTQEGWEDSYVPDAPRYFARYSLDELNQLVGSVGFDVREMRTVSGKDRDWLACVCVASDHAAGRP